MFENLFIASRQNIKEEIVTVKTNFRFNGIEEYEKQKIGFFFYYNIEKRKLYYAELASVCQVFNKEELKTSISAFVCGLQFKNGYLQLNFKSNLEETTEEILKNLYAKSNKEMVGDRNFSFSHTFMTRNFHYALPIIDRGLFNQDNTFLDLILHEDSIIPKVTGENKHFAKIIDEDGQLFLSLTNQKMLKMDYEYLLQEQHKELYRPYFYEFALSDQAQQIIKENDYKDELLYEIEIISKKDAQSYEKEKNTLLEGTLLFSASPIKEIPAYIKILHTNLDQTIQMQFNEIENFLQGQIETSHNKDEIEKAFLEKVSLTTGMNVSYTVNIYNVGQANWIQIFVYDSEQKLISSIVYDIGMGSCLDVNLRKQVAEKAANSIERNNLFVLSHWDMDHILGVVELKRHQFHTTWIMPDLPKKLSNGAKRLAAFLSIDPNINSVFVDESLKGQIIFDNEFFMLGKGKSNNPSTDTSYTVNNNLGLILVIKTATQKMLFPGDCEYIQFPVGFFQNYDAMVISHHGAKIKQLDLTILGFPIANCTNKFAVSCVGKNPSYPETAHKGTIEALGYKLDKTRNYKDVDRPCQKVLN